MDNLLDPIAGFISDVSLLTASSLAIFVFLYKLWRVLTSDVSHDASIDQQEHLISEVMKDNERLRNENLALHREIRKSIDDKMQQEILIIRYEECFMRLRTMAIQCREECPLLEILSSPIFKLCRGIANVNSYNENS